MLYNVKGPTNTAKPDDEEGLPWWWDGLRCRSPRAASRHGARVRDTMRIFKSNIEQTRDAPPADGAPLAEGDISAGRRPPVPACKYARRFGPAHKLCFGPVIYRAVRRFTGTLCTSHEQQGHNKGVLAEIKILWERA